MDYKLDPPEPTEIENHVESLSTEEVLHKLLNYDPGLEDRLRSDLVYYLEEE